jgi:nucleoside-diphosphate-sugar epimerase
MVYGAVPDNPVPLPEDAPVAAEPDSGVVGDHLEIEALVRRCLRSHPGLEVIVLRPAAVVGPGVDTVVTRHFEAPRLLTVKGSAPRWQFCHVEDLVSALEMAALGQVSGVVSVGSDGWLEMEQVEELSGLRRFELPAGLTFGTAQRLHRLGITPAPATDLHYVVYPWVVDCASLRAAGWKPVWTNEAAFQQLLELGEGRHAVVGRRLSGKEATITAATAASATVAVIGTAAIVRRARRKRRT